MISHRNAAMTAESFGCSDHFRTLKKRLKSRRSPKLQDVINQFIDEKNMARR